MCILKECGKLIGYFHIKIIILQLHAYARGFGSYATRKNRKYGAVWCVLVYLGSDYALKNSQNPQKSHIFI